MNTPQRSRVPPGRLYVIPSLLGVVPPEAVLPQRTIDIARGLAHFVVETPKAARQFLKTPYRNDALVDAILLACRPELRFCIAVDLTLPAEQVESRTIAAWCDVPRPSLAKRPAIFLLGAP